MLIVIAPFFSLLLPCYDDWRSELLKQSFYGQNRHCPFLFCCAIHASIPTSFIFFKFSTVLLWWDVPSELNSFKIVHGNSSHWKQYWTPLFLAQSIILQSGLQWTSSGPLHPLHLICSGLTVLLRSFLNHSTISFRNFSLPRPARYMSHFAQFKPQAEITHFSEFIMTTTIYINDFH